MIRTLKPRSSRVKRVLDHRAPKIVENTKKALFLRTQTGNEVTSTLLRDLYALKKPDGVLFSRKNPILPFESTQSLEFLSQKNDTSLFCLVSSNKKRPNNVVLGRLFDHQLLDMQEFGIVDYRPIADIAGPKIGIGSKHPMIFTGQAFEQRPEFQRVKSLVLDFYQGQEVKLIDLAAMDHVMCWTADDDGQRLYLRVYRLVLKKSGSRLPRVELAEVGPAVDFELRRSLGASKETMHEALKVSRTIKPKKVKNVTQRTDGSYGRIHLGRQDLSQLHLRKIKGLKRRSGGEAEAQSNAPDAEAEEAVNDEPELTPRKRARRG